MFCSTPLRRAWILAGLVFALLVVPAAAAGRAESHPAPPSFTPWAPAAALLQPARAHLTPRHRPTAPNRAPATTILRVRGTASIALRARPGGPVIAELSARTEFGSRAALPVLARRGRWLGVPSSDLANGRLGWVHAGDRRLRAVHTRLWLHVTRARRTLELMSGRTPLLRAPVGVGAPGSPTPAGRFAVTDELPGPRFSAAYGCCVLALSAHQPKPPAGWSNGTRMAIHGTNAPATVGQASSAGCLHARAATLRVLMRRVPVGAVVVIE